MSFEKEVKYGVIKIESKTIKLYTTQSSYSSINVGDVVKDARWAGSELIVYLQNGKIRKYKTYSSYSTIS
jgi:hypothetical protein